MVDKKNTLIILAIFILFIGIVCIMGYFRYNELDFINARVIQLPDIEITSLDIVKIELFHFHGIVQCNACKTIGKYAEETVNTYFQDELKSGKIIFEHINIEFPENQEIVSNYNAVGSTLWLGVYKNDGSFSKEECEVKDKIHDKPAFMNYLKQIIEQKLQGN